MEIISLVAIFFIVQPFLEKLSLASDNKLNLTFFLLLSDSFYPQLMECIYLQLNNIRKNDAKFVVIGM